MSTNDTAGRKPLPTDPQTPIYVGRNRSNKNIFHLYEDCLAFSDANPPREKTLGNKPLRSECCSYCEERHRNGGEAV